MAITSFLLARMGNRQLFEKTATEQLDIIPENFNNSIRWNFGHAIVIAERIFSLSEHYQPILPEHYLPLFNIGTSPKAWGAEADIPSAEELLEMSTKQIAAISALYETNGNDVLSKPFVIRGAELKTVIDLFSFLCLHEGMHYEKSKILSLFINQSKTVAN